MQRKIIVVLMIAVLILVAGIQLAAFSQEQTKSEIDTDKIIQKLDQILANQELIFKQFEQINQELEVIRVRASR